VNANGVFPLAADDLVADDRLPLESLVCVENKNAITALKYWLLAGEDFLTALVAYNQHGDPSELPDVREEAESTARILALMAAYSERFAISAEVGIRTAGKAVGGRNGER
jgi:hypothetical protein